jgi:hypothetical protein
VIGKAKKNPPPPPFIGRDGKPATPPINPPPPLGKFVEPVVPVPAPPKSERKSMMGGTVEETPTLSDGKTPAPVAYKDPHDDPIAILNRDHAVSHIGGRTCVIRLGTTYEFPRQERILMRQTVADFKLLQNKYFHEYEDDKGKTVRVPLGNFWIGHPDRRQFDGGLQFMPQQAELELGGVLNLWRGFGVEARKPEGKTGAEGCALFLRFMHEVICDGNFENYHYLIRREATILQKRIRSEVALGMQSDKEGAGKGNYEKVMRRLLGCHAMQIANSDHLIGKHNEHLETKLRLTADEALFADNSKHRNVLFNLITEPELTVEPKFFGAYQAPNFLNISLTSNSRHYLPVGPTARRFFALIVSPKRVGDREYFARMFHQLENEGGYEALLYFFLHEVSLLGFDVRNVPKTDGLVAQAAQGRRGVDGMVELACNTGIVPGAWRPKPGFSEYSGDDGFEAHCNKHSDREIKGKPLVVMNQLRHEWACLTGDAARFKAAGISYRGIMWPPLLDLRREFEAKHGPQQWTEPELTEWAKA